MAAFHVEQDPTSGTWYIRTDDDPTSNPNPGHTDPPKPIDISFLLQPAASPRFAGGQASVASAAQPPAAGAIQASSHTQNQPQLLINNPLLSLTLTTSDNKQTAQIQIMPLIWAFDAPNRATVRPYFDDFLVKFEALEGNQVVPGATRIVRKLLALSLRSTFAENLYFHYGFFRQAGTDPQGFIDLHAGMRLRLDYAFNQFVSPANAGDAYSPLLNGFVAGGQSFFHVIETTAADGKPRLGFDAFLAANTLPLVSPAAGGAGGLIDLQGAGQSRRYVRLCYPTQMPPSDAPGFVGPRKNVTLIGANDLASLAAATQAYYGGAQTGGPDLKDVSTTFFRGRVLIVPEILCFMNDTQVYVPVGTTFRQLVQRFGLLTRLPGLRLHLGSDFSAHRYVPSFQLSNDRKTVEYNDTYADINIDPSGPGLADGYDVPVLASDTVKFPTS
jgi:hypothetical protein